MLKTIFLVFLYVAFSAVGNVLVSCGMRQRAVYVPHVILGTVILTLGYGIYLGLLKEVPLSVVVPAGAGSYLFIAAISRWALNETVPTMRWVGAFVVSIGVSLVMFSDWQMRKATTNAAQVPGGVSAPARASSAERPAELAVVARTRADAGATVE
jgi:drug/metabolite transporter (DMT)-like permease